MPRSGECAAQARFSRCIRHNEIGRSRVAAAAAVTGDPISNGAPTAARLPTWDSRPKRLIEADALAGSTDPQVQWDIEPDGGWK